LKYYIIAGEASGDLHASNLLKEIKSLDKDADFRGWGGDLMQKEGVDLVKHYKDTAYMGFVEVLFHLRDIFRNIDHCKKDIIAYKPDVLILIDYPGFNLRIADFAKKTGLKVVYYISPQVWAWKESRVKKMKINIGKMLVILPFEKDFFKKHNWDVDFVGHPLLDAISSSSNTDKEKFYSENNLEKKEIIALIPGSRKQEINKMLPVMLSLVENFKQYQFVIAGAPAIQQEFYKSFLERKEVKVLYNQTYKLMQNAKAALVTSGTATLETALFEVPEVVCYKGNPISFFIAKRLVKVKFISLVNLIMDREIVKELIQKDFNRKNLQNELQKLLYNENFRSSLKTEYADLKVKLGGQGASRKAAISILSFIKTL
jgi:lipid-A-disaccharide synthase